MQGRNIYENIALAHELTADIDSTIQGAVLPSLSNWTCLRPLIGWNGASFLPVSESWVSVLTGVISYTEIYAAAGIPSHSMEITLATLGHQEG